MHFVICLVVPPVFAVMLPMFVSLRTYTLTRESVYEWMNHNNVVASWLEHDFLVYIVRDEGSNPMFQREQGYEIFMFARERYLARYKLRVRRYVYASTTGLNYNLLAGGYNYFINIDKSVVLSVFLLDYTRGSRDAHLYIHIILPLKLLITYIAFVYSLFLLHPPERHQQRKCIFEDD